MHNSWGVYGTQEYYTDGEGAELHKYGIRPVVTLNANTELTKNGKNWDIKLKSE